MKGFAAVGLHRPKDFSNVGGVMRAAHAFHADLVVIGGHRPLKKVTHIPTDTSKAYRHVPTLRADDLFDVHPVGSVPIAIDLVPGSIPLHSFVHPVSAYYIFGPEDGTLGKEIIDRCAFKVYIPSVICLNLAATVNVVLYDRSCKREKAPPQDVYVPVLGSSGREVRPRPVVRSGADPAFCFGRSRP